MDVVTVTKQFDGSVQEMADRCRTLDSRKQWPGSVLMGGGGATLYYQVSMRLKAAAMTDLDIEEKQGDLQTRPDGTLAFTTVQKVSWPDGLAVGETEYVFTPGSPNTLTYTYRYEPPPSKLVKAKALPGFRDGMQKVVERYVSKLTTTVSA